jgi:hypothetical protein
MTMNRRDFVKTTGAVAAVAPSAPRHRPRPGQEGRRGRRRHRRRHRGQVHQDGRPEGIDVTIIEPNEEYYTCY